MHNKFGAFNPRFTGIDIHCPTFQDFLDFSDSHSQEGRGNVTTRFRALLADDPQSAFRYMSLVTTVEHETRHFHDHLLSPMGNAVFRSRIIATINGFQIISFLSDLFDVHPIPITRWLTMTDPELEALRGDMESRFDGKGLRIPTQFPKELTAVAKKVAGTYQSIQNYVYNPDGVRNEIAWQPRHVFEASAHMVQLQAVWQLFGKEGVELFQNRLERTPASFQYTSLVKVLRSLAPNSPIDSQLAATISVWGMLGNYSIDEWKACPTHRIATLMDRLSEKDLEPSAADPLSLMDNWSQITELSEISQSLRNSIDKNDEFILELEADRRIGREFPVLVRAATQFREASNSLISEFLNDPSQYIWPRPYLENQDKWPAAPIRFRFWPNALILAGDMPNDYHLLIGKRSEDGTISIHSMAPDGQTPGIEYFQLLQADEAASEMVFNDIYFAPFDRIADPMFSVYRERTSDKDPYLHEILK